MGKINRANVQIEYKALPILTKQIGEDRVVRSIFAVAGNVDSGGDRIWPGAFQKTLREQGDRIRVLWQHEIADPPIGVPVALRELGLDELPPEVKSRYPEATGALYGEIKYLDTPRGNEVLTGIAEGAIKENSIGYDPVKFDYESEGTGLIRNLREVRLWDISPVNFAMNAGAVNLKAAIPYRQTPKAPEDDPWDGPAEVAAADVSDLRIMCAWYDAENPDLKSSYKLPHHRAGGEHAVVWRGVAAAMAALLGSGGGVDIPEADVPAVYRHLARHYDEFGREAPALKLVQLAISTRTLLGPGGLKEGRVLSSQNLEKLKNALAVLQEILLAAEPPEEEQKALTVQNLWTRLELAQRELSLVA